MAVTAIWNITGRISSALAYVENPDKTIAPESLNHLSLSKAEKDDLIKAIEYTAQERKTTGSETNAAGLFITGINCDADEAYSEMMDVKRAYGKTGGNTAYHAYQSFSPGEGTPEIVHEIGVKLARELWGSRFQVAVATHLDKGHLHNHFIINSVSFRDGGKYNDCRKTYQAIREVSDRLCSEYGLSVIKNPPHIRAKGYPEWQAEKTGKPTMRSLVKADVDRIIGGSMTDREFFAKLKQMGYSVKHGKDITLTPPGKERGVRLARNFGEDYSADSIRRRILLQTEPAASYKVAGKQVKRKGTISFAEKPKRKINGYYGLYLRYQYELVIRHRGSPGKNKRMHFLLREDIGKLDQIYSEMTLLRENGIKTREQLFSYQNEISEKIAAHTGERKELYRSLRRKNAHGSEDVIKEDISVITKELRFLRRELKKCESIKERSGLIEKNLCTIQSQKNEGTQMQVKKEELNHGYDK